MAGTVFICSLPIGDLGDITYNVVDCLKTVPVIAAEDTRIAQSVLKDLNILSNQQFIRMDQHQEKRSLTTFQQCIDNGDVAFVSDAGSPGVSDPGAMLVDYCRMHDISVKCYPGASAVTAFISGCGVLMGTFYFGGFLPRKEGDLARLLQWVIDRKMIGIWFESPKRILTTIKWLALMYPSMDVVLAKELTKPYECYFRGTAKDVYAELLTVDCRGEWVCLFNGETIDLDPLIRLSKIAESMIDIGLSGTQVKQLASVFDLPKNKLYEIFQEQSR